MFLHVVHARRVGVVRCGLNLGGEKAVNIEVESVLWICLRRKWESGNVVAVPKLMVRQRKAGQLARLITDA